MEQGKIAKTGIHDELLAKMGFMLACIISSLKFDLFSLKEQTAVVYVIIPPLKTLFDGLFYAPPKFSTEICVTEFGIR